MTSQVVLLVDGEPVASSDPVPTALWQAALQAGEVAVVREGAVAAVSAAREGQPLAVLVSQPEVDRPGFLGLALGGATYKLPFGHHGANHPVKDLATGKVEITSQNHGFAVDVDSLKGRAELTHVNLNDNTVEGMKLADKPVFSVQYHPEASPGPHDAAYLFGRFIDVIRKRRAA